MDNKYKKLTAIVVFIVMMMLPSIGYSLKMSKRYVLGPGNYIRNLQFEGTNRFYKVHVPSSYSKVNPVPVVLVFHAAAGHPDAIRYQSGMDSVSDENGFIVVYPAGNKEMLADGLLRWNDGRNYIDGFPVYVNDVGFVKTLLDDLVRFFYVDAKRVYACGLSNGALFTNRIAKELSDRIAAIAVVAGQRSAYELFPPPSKPMPVMQFSGLQDIFAPYYGGSSYHGLEFYEFENTFEPVEEVIQSWVTFNGCPAEPAEVNRIGNAVQTVYGPCIDNVEVVLWTLEDGGHTWPGGNALPLPPLVTALIGNINKDISASVLIWEFFEKFQLN